MYETILLPVDGSEESMAALEHAIDLAGRHEATLDVLFVAENGDEEDDEANDTVEAVAAPAREAGLHVNTAVLMGVPAESILEYVEDRGVDAVVMGTHGRSGFDRYVGGSVTESVLRNVDVPVLVVPVGADAP